MKKRLFPVLMLSAMAAQPVRAATLTVVIDHVPDTRGHVRVAVCGKSEFLGMHCRYHGMAQAAAGTVRIALPDVAPGIYALQAFQDTNDNGRIDRNILGIPTEPMGFSRDARMMFGPPRFDDASVRIGTADCELRFSLHGF